MTERQMGRCLDEIALDHVERYRWAAQRITDAHDSPHVLDAAAGTGYGSYILALAGCRVHAVDISAVAAEAHRCFYKHPHVDFEVADVNEVNMRGYDAIVSFETIEHVDYAPFLVSRFRENTSHLLTSVPNEDVKPFSEAEYGPFHKRHYTPDEFRDLLGAWRIEEFTQYRKWKEGAVVRPGFDGRTLVVDATQG